jgi:RNA polymerase sigma-70 factor (ECF subfamily)
MDWHETRENARDLTQEYFTQLIEKHVLEQLPATQISFRAFIKTTLRHFMVDARRRAEAQKRGGAIDIVPIDAADIDRVESEAVRQHESPDELFDREFVRGVLDDALRELGQGMEAEGQRDQFDLFRRYYSQGTTYETLAAETGCSVADITNRLHAVRSRYRERLLNLLRDGATSSEELCADVRRLCME